MLESTTNQASGLLALAPQQGPRLMAVVSHGDDRAELPLLWRICAALVDFGYAVTVLDATVCESEANPGLEQMLECNYSRMAESLDAPAWTVVPAARGVQGLCAIPAQKSHNLSRLGRMFPHAGVVILYSNAEWLVALLGESECSPLLPVSSQKNSLMTSYLALKRLLKNGKLQPTVVNLAQNQRAVAVSLSECAKTFLDYDVKPINIRTLTEESFSGGDVPLLALRLLEGALALANTDSLPMTGLGSRVDRPQPFLSH